MIYDKSVLEKLEQFLVLFPRRPAVPTAELQSAWMDMIESFERKPDIIDQSVFAAYIEDHWRRAGAPITIPDDQSVVH